MNSRRVFCLLGILAIMALAWNASLGHLTRWGSYRKIYSRYALASELGAVRPTEGRLGGLQYAPWLPRNHKIADEKVRKIWKVIRRNEDDYPEAGLNAVEGLLRLVEGKPKEAIEKINESLSGSPDDSILLADLSAAYLACENEPIQLLLALSAVDNAVKINPSLLEARFNLALSLERLYLLNQAQEAWEVYLKLDPRSLWAEEAQRHLDLVKEKLKLRQWNKGRSLLVEALLRGEEDKAKQIVLRFPEEAREYAEEDLVADWAMAKLSNEESRAHRSIRHANIVAGVLVELRSGQLLADALDLIDRVSSDDPIAMAALIRGHLAYREARILYKQHRSEEAVTLFNKANDEFETVGSPFGMWTKLYLAIIQYERYALRSATSILINLEGNNKINKYPEVLGRVYWVMGLAHIVSGEPMSSLDFYYKGLSVFESMDADNGAAAIHNMIAENYRYLGQYSQSWSHLYESLVVTSKYSDFRRLHAILDEAAEISERYLGPRTALYFRDEIARLALNVKEPTAVSHALLRRSESRLLNGEVDKARWDLARADFFWRRIPDAVQSARVGADLAALRGSLVLTARPEEAVVFITQALEFYRERGNELPVGRMYLLRARAHLALGEYLLAENDLKSGIAEFEHQRSLISEERFRISFFDELQEVFDRMITLQAKKLGRHDVAFGYSEQKRARVLLDRVGSLLTKERRQSVLSRTILPLKTDQIVHEVPVDTAIIQYCVMKDSLFIWVIKRGRLDFFEMDIDASDLEREVKELEEGLATIKIFDVSSSRLYDNLVRPIYSAVSDVKSLVFVPDKILHRVPFAALLRRESRRYLIEDYQVSVSPSATLYLSRMKQLDRLGDASELSALVVGSSGSDSRDLSFPMLAQVEAEAAGISQMYSEGEVLLGDKATKKSVLSMIRRYNIAHFAVHAFVNNEHPLSSYLLLASNSQGDPDVLYAHELYQLHCENLYLVVLASCESASGTASGEGVISLARSFIAAGALQVIASLWRVEDSTAKEFSMDLHRRYLEKGDAAAALREVQIAWINVGRSGSSEMPSPAAWAGFQAM